MVLMSEPVAIMMFFALMTDSPPSSSFTLTSFLLLKLPHPLTYVTCKKQSKL